MYLKHLIIIVSTLMCASTEMSVGDETYLNFSAQLDSVKKSIEILKVQQDAMSERNSCDYCSVMEQKFAQVSDNFGVVKQSFDDLNIRLDAFIDYSKKEQPDKEQNFVDKELFDELQNKLDALTDKFQAQQQHFDGKMEILESQQKILVQEMSEMKGNYSNILNELNTVKLSEKSFREQYIDLEEKYLELLNNTENDKKSKNDLNLRIDNITTQLSNIFDKEDYDKKTLFDVRVDKLPEFKKLQCHQDPEPIDCKAATKCTQKSGYYKIYLPGNKAKQIMVYCDMEIAGGNWMHILRRIDGSENFNRTWSEYVNGFGQVESEYWIGLENLYALTENNGRQILYIHMERFSGVSSYALYSYFYIGGATEKYELKHLGYYEGTAIDGMSYSLNQKFSAYDYDNDVTDINCAALYGGWWHKFCSYSQPTGTHHFNKGVRWENGNSNTYFYNIMYFMIRSF